MQKMLAFLLLFTPVLALAKCVLPVQTVPFENLFLDSGCLVQAEYAFGNYPLIFCYTNTLQSNVSTMSWPYNGTRLTGTLPRTLSNNPNYTGDPANPAGRLIIVNTSAQLQIVSCQQSL